MPCCPLRTSDQHQVHTPVMFSSAEEKYQALVERNPKAEGVFVYGVRTTNIVCRPTCLARVPLFKNVEYFENVEEARKQGFRHCKRCKPEIENNWNKQRLLVLRIIAYISRLVLDNPHCTSKEIRLEKLADNFAISKWHMLRTFKRYTGKTPFQYFCQFKKVRVTAHVPLVETKRNLILQKKRQDKGNITGKPRGKAALPTPELPFAPDNDFEFSKLPPTADNTELVTPEESEENVESLFASLSKEKWLVEGRESICSTPFFSEISMPDLEILGTFNDHCENTQTSTEQETEFGDMFADDFFDNFIRQNIQLNSLQK